MERGRRLAAGGGGLSGSRDVASLAGDDRPVRDEARDRTCLITLPRAVSIGGAETLLRQLVGLGGSFRWCVVSLEDGPLLDDLRVLGADVLVEARHWDDRSPELSDELLALAPGLDAVVGWMDLAHPLGRLVAERLDVPCAFYQLHIPKQDNERDRSIASIPADAIFAVSEAAAGVQRALSPGAPVVTVHPGVDLEAGDHHRQLPRDELRRDLGVDGAFVICTVARLERSKGLETLVRALPLIAERAPEVVAVVVGPDDPLSGGHADELRERAEQAGVADRLRLVGGRRDVLRWMAAADVVVHPARHEAFGIVVVEALSVGTPVVACLDGGVGEIVTDGVDAIAFPAGDSEALAQAVLRLVHDPDLARSLARAGRRRSRDFPLGAYVRAMEQQIAAIASR